MAFELDEEGMLTVKATALGPADVALAMDSKTTTIQHEKTWTVTLNFGGT